MLDSPKNDTTPINTPKEAPSLPHTDPSKIFSAASHYHSDIHKNKWSLLPIFILLIIGGIMVRVVSIKKPQDIRSRAALTGPKLSISPATKSAAIGSTISLGIILNTDTDTVSATDLHLTYDSTAIQIVSFSPGTPLSVVLTPESHINNSLSVTLGVSPSAPFKGNNSIGTLNVKILAAKESTITFTDATQIAAIGKTTNALTSTTGAAIIGTSTVTSPTPTSLNADTPTPTSKTTSMQTPTPTTSSSLNSPTPTLTPKTTMSFGDFLSPTPTPMTVHTGNAITPPEIPIPEELPSFTNTVDQITPPTKTTDQITIQPTEANTSHTRTIESSKPTVFQQLFASIIEFFRRIF